LALSKRATSVSVVVGELVTRDIAILDKGWTHVVTGKLIVVEIQIICETENQTKRIFMRALREEKR
jgi:hypothetical protein